MRPIVKAILVPLTAAWSALITIGARSPSAWAADGPALTWSAPEDCPGADAFRASVEQLVERPWAELDTELAIDTRVDQVDGRWLLDLSVRLRGEPLPPRNVEGESCAALVDAGAAIIALLVERELVPSEVNEPVAPNEATAAFEPLASEPKAAPPPEPEAKPKEDASPSTEPPAAPPKRRQPLAGIIEMAPLVDAFSLPRASLGARLGGGLGGRSWFATLGALGLLPVQQSLGSKFSEGATARFWLLTGQLRGCHVLGRASVRLAACGVFESGWLQGSTRNVTDPDWGGAPWLSLGPELGLLVGGSSAHRLYVGVSTPFPLLHPEFVIDTENAIETAHQPPIVTLRGSIGYHLDL